MLRGIDISTYQDPRKMNYDTMAKQLDFVILRIGFTGYGTNPPHTNNFNKDNQFETHYAEFTKRGVPIGVYWYGGAVNTAEVDKEIAVMMEALKGKKIEYPVYYDVEENRNHGTLSKGQLTEVAKDWCRKVEGKGYYTGIYTSLNWTNVKLDMTQLPFTLWLAQWHVSKPAKACDMWQYTSDGKLNGYSGRLDMNTGYVDFKKVITEAGLNHLGDAPTPAGGKFAIGQEVIINGTLFGTSAGGNAGSSVSNRRTKITRYVAGASKPYNTTGDLGWVAESQVSAVGSKPKPTGLQVGDTVKITGAGNAQASGRGGTAGGIGWERQVLAIHTGSAFPYQVGNASGTTGFYRSDSLQKK